MKVPINSIKVDREKTETRRFRKDLGDLPALAKSIHERGLINPLTVRPQDDGSYLLVAGERRLLAALTLGWSEIDVRPFDDLSALEQKLIELEENACRKDIDFREQAEALRQLHLLKQREHGQRTQGDASASGWGIEDTAKMVGASLATVSQDISFATDCATDPELRAAALASSTKFEARKAIEREKRARRIQQKLERSEIVIASELQFGCAEDLIKHVPSDSVQLLLTDPPWGEQAILDVQAGNLSSKYDRGTNVQSMSEMEPVFRSLIPELARVLVPGAHFYWFHSIDSRALLLELLRSNGFLPHSVPLIWAKQRTTMIPNPYHYIPSYEFILFGSYKKQSRTLAKPKPNCLLDYPAPAPQARIHSLQKPRGLIELFILNSSVPGELVLDPFAGSAITLKTAKELGRSALGFESDEANYNAAQEFLQS